MCEFKEIGVEEEMLSNLPLAQFQLSVMQNRRSLKSCIDKSLKKMLILFILLYIMSLYQI